jgi:hypothetical protein
MLQPSPSVATELALLAESVERFCLVAHRTTGEELSTDLPELSRCLNLLQLKFSEMATAFAATDEYDRQGAYSPIHWIRVNCHMTSAAAGDRLAVGDLMQRVPQSVEAMAAGEIGFPHLALIAREAEAVAESGTNNSFDETRLLDKARDFTVGRFRNFCHHERHANDVRRYIEQEVEAVEARTLSMRTGEGGMLWIRGILDPQGGHLLRTAIEPLARRNGHGDDRKHDRRLADGMVEMASRLLDGGSLPVHAAVRPHLQVTASLDTLLRHCGAPAADVELSLPISAAAVERLACDCSLTRILLGPESQVIDVGRSRRVISPAQRRALRVRDKTCQWPGCDRPASYTSGHHLVHWIRNGPTDLDNLVLLCHRHHWMVHEGGWQIVRREDRGYNVVPPPPAPFFATARSPGTTAA